MARQTAGATRAKRAYLKVRKRNKYGKPYVGQNEVVVSHGMFSAKEAHRELQKAADEASAEGQEVVDAVIEGYDRGENPELSSNPRHRGIPRSYLSKKGKRQEREKGERISAAKREAEREAEREAAREPRSFAGHVPLTVGGFQAAGPWLRESPRLRREEA